MHSAATCIDRPSCKCCNTCKHLNLIVRLSDSYYYCSVSLAKDEVKTPQGPSTRSWVAPRLLVPDICHEKYLSYKNSDWIMYMDVNIRPGISYCIKKFAKCYKYQVEKFVHATISVSWNFQHFLAMCLLCDTKENRLNATANTLLFCKKTVVQSFAGNSTHKL